MSTSIDSYTQLGQVEPEPQEPGDVEPEPAPEPTPESGQAEDNNDSRLSIFYYLNQAQTLC